MAAFGAFERMMAFRYLRARRQEGFISVIAWFSLLGIALGVATLIIVMAVMNGFRAELLGRIVGLNGHVTLYSLEGGFTDYEAVAMRVRGARGVVSASPLVESQVLATANGVASGAMVRGMRAADLAARPLVSGNVVRGSWGGFDEGDGVAIGSRMAQKFRVGVGDQITLISPQGNVTAFGTTPRMRAYRVATIFEVGMFEYDSGYVYMPLQAAQVFFRLGAGVSGVEVIVADPDRIAPARRAIADAAGPGVRVFDWQQANASFFGALQVERNVMFLILTLIILVAAFNIISSLIMLVKDKSRDIAILRTMGAARGSVMRIFLMAGASVGVIGTAAGFALGVAFCANIETIRQWLQSMMGWQLFPAEIYFLSRMPAKMDPVEVAYVVAMALALSFLATVYPSWRAARLDPVEALRHE
jgi:lipoprotein-releasing system permease protein